MSQILHVTQLCRKLLTYLRWLWILRSPTLHSKRQRLLLHKTETVLVSNSSSAFHESMVLLCAFSIQYQGSYSEWKTWKNGKAFSSQGKKSGTFEQARNTRKVREFQINAIL